MPCIHEISRGRIKANRNGKIVITIITIEFCHPYFKYLTSSSVIPKEQVLISIFPDYMLFGISQHNILEVI